MLRLLVSFVFVAAPTLAQIDGAAPTFDAQHVYFVDHPVPLAPGLVLSIFGNHLGPAAGCKGEHDEKGVYPSELCGVQVFVGGVASGLLWVQDRQINFQVPQQTPTEGTAETVVVHQGRRSTPVTMPLGFERTTYSVEPPARVGMPIWLDVSAPYYRSSGIRYPFMIFPASFGCYEVEVLHDGKLLPRIADMGTQAFGGIVYAGPPCGSVAFRTEVHYKDRLPLHLQYRFDEPGTYEVRITKRQNFFATSKEEPSTTTPWIKIEILPADESARETWLMDKIAHAPADAADLLTDFLPSILGNPDEESLAALRPYLYHADHTVREYAKYGLTYWPADQAAATVWEWVREQGPSEAAVDFLLHAKTFTHAEELLQISLAYLESDSPVLAEGAARAITQIALTEDPRVSPGLRAKAIDALKPANLPAR